MTKQEALFNYTLRLGDTSLILAQRLSEWTGHGPFLEEDLALTNIALDIFGRAKSLLEYANAISSATFFTFALSNKCLRCVSTVFSEISSW